MFYAPFTAAMEAWGVPHGPKARQSSSTRRFDSVWDVARIFSNARTKKLILSLQQLGSQDPAPGKYIPVKAVPFAQLQDINDGDIREALELQMRRDGEKLGWRELLTSG